MLNVQDYLLMTQKVTYYMLMGEAGQQLDKFSNGVALAYFGDNLLVLDKELRTVIVYEHTKAC